MNVPQKIILTLVTISCFVLNYEVFFRKPRQIEDEFTKQTDYVNTLYRDKANLDSTIVGLCVDRMNDLQRSFEDFRQQRDTDIRVLQKQVDGLKKCHK